MSREKAEGRPKNIPVFPLNPNSVSHALHGLLYVEKQGDLDQLDSYAESILKDARVSPAHLIFFKRMNGANETNLSSLYGTFHGIGFLIGVDAIEIERRRIKGKRFEVTGDDVVVHSIHREELTGEVWRDSSNEGLKELREDLLDMIGTAEPSFIELLRILTQTEPKKWSESERLLNHIDILLGLGDAYFPARYAEHRSRAAQGLS